LKTPLIPNGSHGPPPPAISWPLLLTLVHSEKSSLPEKIAATKKNASTAIDSTVIATVNRIVASMPTMLMPTKIT
jgi:hypothetical protein